MKISVILKAVARRRIVGSVRLVLSGDACLLGRLIVSPAVQGQGIGSALLAAGEAVFPEANMVELFTGSRSTGNIRFYEDRGYVRTREEALSSKVTLVYLRKCVPSGTTPRGGSI
jgi:predicted N-acetyltransferase YhbS